MINVFRSEPGKHVYSPGTVSADGVAVVGHQGWLYLCSGSNSVMDQYRGQTPLPTRWLENWRQALAVRRTDVKALGAHAISIVVPDKLGVLSAHSPWPVHPEVVPAQRLHEQFGEVMFPRRELAGVADGAYLRTDTHLSFAGNERLGSLVLSCLGVNSIERTPDTSEVKSGDLGSRFRPEITETVYVGADFGSAELIEDNYAQMTRRGKLGGIRRVLHNAHAPDPRLAVVFGDSYSFPTPDYHGIAWHLAQAFATVHFVWIPFGWDAAYARASRAEVIVFECAERFAIRVPQLCDVIAESGI